VTAPVGRARGVEEEPGDELGAHELADLAPVAEVPAAGRTDQAQHHPGHVLGRRGHLDAGPEPLGGEVRLEEGGDGRAAGGGPPR
jgi:hypothetical protein